MMSNLLAAATEPQHGLPPGGVLVLLIWTAVAVVVAWKAGVFSPATLRAGEPRLASDEPLLNFGMILLAGLVIWVMIPAAYGAASRAGATQPATSPEQMEPAQLINLTAGASVTALLILLAGNALFRRGGLRLLGLRREQIMPALGIGLVAIVMIMPLITWVGLLTMKVWEALDLEHDTKHEMLRILEQTDDRQLAWMLIFTAAVIAPLFEEVLFRGHLQTLLVHIFARAQRRRDVVMEAYAGPNAAVMRPQTLSPSARWLAIAATSLCFAIVHPWWTMPPIFFLSICLGYAYERWNNLWLPIVLHALFNTISMMISRYMP